MKIRWTDSCSKHGVPREDALHAMLFHVAFFPGFDEPRGGRTAQPDLWLGPQRHKGAPLLEIMSTTEGTSITVFHVMVARRKFLDTMTEKE